MITKREILFRHPEEPSLEWTGYGRKPKWVDAFISQGGSMEQLSTLNLAKQPESVTVTKKPAIDQAQLPGLPPIPKKRGRPSTGRAKTPAERKQEQRSRDRQRYGKLQEATMTLTGLLEAYSFAYRTNNPEACISIAEVLTQRALALRAKIRDGHDIK